MHGKPDARLLAPHAPSTIDERHVGANFAAQCGSVAQHEAMKDQEKYSKGSQGGDLRSTTCVKYHPFQRAFY
jgi:hypothetical protein